jgi:hypothetical protein
MSYVIRLRAPRSEPCAACGRPYEEPDALPNPPHDLTPIFELALVGEELPGEPVRVLAPRGLYVLSGRRAGDTIEWIEDALGRLVDPKLWLESKNKLGTLGEEP